jgi:hypothetical protein
MAEVALVDPELQTLFGCTRKVSRHFSALLNEEGGLHDSVESIDDIVPDYWTMRERWLQPGGDFLFPRDKGSKEAALGLPVARVRMESVRLHGPKSPLLDKLIFTFVEEEPVDDLGLFELGPTAPFSNSSPQQDSSLSPQGRPSLQHSPSSRRSLSPKGSPSDSLRDNPRESPRNSRKNSPSPRGTPPGGSGWSSRNGRDLRGSQSAPPRRINRFNAPGPPKLSSANFLPDAVLGAQSNEASRSGHRMTTFEMPTTHEFEPSESLDGQAFFSTKARQGEEGDNLDDLLEVR